CSGTGRPCGGFAGKGSAWRRRVSAFPSDQESSVNAPGQMDDRGPEALAETECRERNEDGRRAPDDQARLQRPERPEARADHEDERRHERVDVERAHPLSVLAEETH